MDVEQRKYFEEKANDVNGLVSAAKEEMQYMLTALKEMPDSCVVYRLKKLLKEMAEKLEVLDEDSADLWESFASKKPLDEALDEWVDK